MKTRRPNFNDDAHRAGGLGYACEGEISVYWADDIFKQGMKTHLMILTHPQLEIVI